ncbi:hypothetical protein KEM56_006544 [Ascosphaera pollenicola]|nr:hypothetical protein KEM56_006544 [Ascosphaera pollenicola]
MRLPCIILPPILALVTLTHGLAISRQDPDDMLLRYGDVQIPLQMAPEDNLVLKPTMTDDFASEEESELILDDDDVDLFRRNKCGPKHGSCPSGLCCSAEGRCLDSVEACAAPDCQLAYSDACDATRLMPPGIDTSLIPRPHIGDVPYGGAGILGCKVPKTVALTYDDGPNVFTEALLDLLDAYQAKATFFITGANSAKGMIDDPQYPWAKIIHRIYEAGHQIASHTWSHQNLDKVSPEQRRNQIVYNEMALNKILGVFPTYMRPPYSDCSQNSGCQDDMDLFGYHIAYFDVDTDDYEQDSPTKIKKSKKIFNNALNKAIATEEPLLVIGHDVHEQTVVSLTPYMLDQLYAAGYRAVTLGECLGDPIENWYRSGALLREVPVPDPSPPRPSPLPTNSSGEPLKRPDQDKSSELVPPPGDKDDKDAPVDKDQPGEGQPEIPTSDPDKKSPDKHIGENEGNVPKTPDAKPDDDVSASPKEPPTGNITDGKEKDDNNPIDRVTPEPIKAPDGIVTKPVEGIVKEPELPKPNPSAGNDVQPNPPIPGNAPARPDTPDTIDKSPTSEGPHGDKKQENGTPAIAPVKETDPIESPIPIPPGLPDDRQSPPQQPIVDPPSGNAGGDKKPENEPIRAPVPVPPPQAEIKVIGLQKAPLEKSRNSPKNKSMKKKKTKPRSDEGNMDSQNDTVLPQSIWTRHRVTLIAEKSTSGATSLLPAWLASLRPIFRP